MTTTCSTSESKSQQNDVAAVEQTRAGASFTPRFDICETEEELVLYGDLPGVKADSLDIQFESNELLLHGRVRPRHESQKFLHKEYGVGDFHRSFTIGESIDASRISAELSNGVLTLHLPKNDRVKARKIEVQGS